MNILILFIILNIVNVSLSTAKSILTVKGGKLTASLMNAIAYGFYTIVIIYMVADFPLWEKVAVVAITNLIGVYIIKLIEEKMKKDKLWKVEATILIEDLDEIIQLINEQKNKEDIDLSYNYININKYYLFNFYCPTQKESSIAKEILNKCNAKYFVSESKVLI